MTPKFPPAEFHRRLNRFREAMVQRELDLCLIHTPENICYLTGHETPGYYTYQCLIVPAEEEPVLVLREAEIANAQTFTYLERIVGFTDAEDPLTRTVEVIRDLGLPVRRVGLEERSWFNPPYTCRRLLQNLAPGRTLAIDRLVAGLRLVKSPLEIEAIRAAARVTNAAMAAAVAACRPGVRERDVAAEAMAALVREGSEYLGMEPFVASGPRSSAIHASWSDRVIEEGEPVLLEMAASVKRYHAALMYTSVTGALPAELDRVVRVCREALAATLEVIRPGTTAADCHRACQKAIERGGLLEYYRKRTGYSIGIAFAPDWGEGHILSLGDGETTPLEPGMVLHVVPAIRIPGLGGAGYSATVLVTETGHEILTRFAPEH